MDVRVVIGWDEATAAKLLSQLCLLPDELEDTFEYLVSDDGINEVNQKLAVLNCNYETNLQWRMYPENHFILVWTTEFEKTIPDPSDEPTSKYRLDLDTGTLQLTKLKNKFGEFGNPYPILLIDATELYHSAYDSDHAQDSDQDSD